jgi:hypothetical protein
MMYRNIVFLTLREQKTQILLAHMSAALVLFADIGAAVGKGISSKGTWTSGSLADRHFDR